jgi:hypothetical protein
VSEVVRCPISQTLRPGLTWQDTWNGADRGLIKCWENGRALAVARPEIAQAASRGELPSLDWKGGISGNPKMKKKFGSLNYLATWQGLRGEDLCVDTETEIAITCTRTRVVVTFTPDLKKLDTDSALPEEPTSENT